MPTPFQDRPDGGTSPCLAARQSFGADTYTTEIFHDDRPLSGHADSQRLGTPFDKQRNDRSVAQGSIQHPHTTDTHHLPVSTFPCCVWGEVQSFFRCKASGQRPPVVRVFDEWPINPVQIFLFLGTGPTKRVFPCISWRTLVMSLQISQP